MLHLKSTVAHSTRILSNQRTTNGNYIYYHNLNQQSKLEWPNRTSQWCRHCCHSFETTPIPIPVAYDRNTKHFAIYGNYCSFACASAWLREHNFPDVAYQRSLLAQMASQVFDYGDPIFSAPPLERLDVFGGDLSIEQFRVYTGTGKQCYVRTPPLIGSTQMLEEHIPPDVSQSMDANDNFCLNMPVEQDIVVHEETITASGKVPPGGLYQEFIQQQKLKMKEQQEEKEEQEEQEEKEKTENKQKQEQHNDREKDENKEGDAEKELDHMDVVKDTETDPLRVTNITKSKPGQRKRKKTQVDVVTGPTLMQFMQ